MAKISLWDTMRYLMTRSLAADGRDTEEYRRNNEQNPKIYQSVIKVDIPGRRGGGQKENVG